ncbi:MULTISPECIES: hypothetical protein [Natrinema]|uniref:Uncharacterized protein n=1 Tax=Natrinema gari JCM 14663 TaxID=1230459 RepID=L9YYJ9_9EURY|nr:MULTISPECIES: hypothetical protein [Natrinema]AFO55424.1 hypothetical protein NJ7G_0169 [Natrinema sp. J7-2]ELY78721.1 hypothetical protein C486_13102 [Natrinema gari JCM 14663]
MSGSRSERSAATEDGRLSPDLIGLAAGAFDVPVFAYLGQQLFGDVAFGAAVGLIVGLGLFLSFPAFLADDERSEPTTAPTAVDDRLRQFHRTAAGLALPPAGILLIAWRFVSENLLLGVLATAIIAMAIYLPLAVLLPQRLS